MGIKLRRSAVANKAPATTDLELGELAINTNDGKLFLKKSVGGTESIVEVGPVISVAGRTGAVTLAKSDVGLGNVDNTSDAAKPVSTATQTALNGKANSVHAHAIADVTGLQTALDGKQAAGSYAAVSHTHTASQISDSTAAGRALLTAADAASQRSSLGLGIGSDVQAFDADLSAIGALAGTSGFLKKTAANSWALDTTVAKTDAINSFVSGQTVGNGAGSSNFSIDGGSGSSRQVVFRTGGLTRWAVLASNNAEGGSNGGSNLLFRNYDDTGAQIGTPISIERATGNISLSGVTSLEGIAPGITRSTSGSTLAVTAAVKNILIDRSATLAALTVTLPTTGVLNGQEMRILTRGTITALTVNVEGGGVGYNLPTGGTLNAGGLKTFVYSSAAGAWFGAA